MKTTHIILFLALSLFIFSTNVSASLRVYEEVIITPNKSTSMDDPHAFMKNHPVMSGDMQNTSPELQQMLKDVQPDTPVNWQTPESWNQEPASGLRLATFTSRDENFPIDCSIVTLSGAAGGVESNLTRWAGQIGLQLSSEQLNQFIQEAETVKGKNDLIAKIYDFTKLIADASEKSILAAVVKIDNTSIFIKLTASSDSINHHRDAFNELISSLAVQ